MKLVPLGCVEPTIAPSLTLQNCSVRPSPTASSGQIFAVEEGAAVAGIGGRQGERGTDRENENESVHARRLLE